MAVIDKESATQKASEFLVKGERILKIFQRPGPQGVVSGRHTFWLLTNSRVFTLYYENDQMSSIISTPYKVIRMAEMQRARIYGAQSFPSVITTVATIGKVEYSFSNENEAYEFYMTIMEHVF